MSRHFGHGPAVPVERPDSVIDPLHELDAEQMTGLQRVVMGVGIVVFGFFGVMVGHGYYIWFLKP